MSAMNVAFKPSHGKWSNMICKLQSVNWKMWIRIGQQQTVICECSIVSYGNYVFWIIMIRAHWVVNQTMNKLSIVIFQWLPVRCGLWIMIYGPWYLECILVAATQILFGHGINQDWNDVCVLYLLSICLQEQLLTPKATNFGFNMIARLGCFQYAFHKFWKQTIW